MMKYTFLILSNQPFDFELKTNKWHIATKLAQRGHGVLFVDPPLRFKALKNFLKKPSLKLSNLFCKTEKKEKNLIVYKPANLFNFFPFSVFNTYLHSKNITRLLNYFIDAHLKAYTTKAESEDKGRSLIVWVYHFDFPDLENFLKYVGHKLLIYDVVDEYTAFPEYLSRKKVNAGLISLIQRIDDELKIQINQRGLSGAEWVLHREKWLAENSDLMFASAPGLVAKFKKWRKEVHYLPNAADVDKFDISRNGVKEPADLAGISRPRIGFTGAIDTYKINIALVEKCAVTYPDFHFVMIGPEKVADPDSNLSKLKSMANVHFLGLKPWEETPAYFACLDAYFIPSNLNDYTLKGHFPVKYFEALAAGLPTIVIKLPAYKGFDVDGYVSASENEFMENIKKALKEDSADRQKKRKQLAKKNSWDRKVAKQLALIDKFFAGNKK